LGKFIAAMVIYY